jgi:hypothetical protein
MFASYICFTLPDCVVCNLRVAVCWLQVLLMTLQGPAPQLDDQPGKPHFSKV